MLRRLRSKKAQAPRVANSQHLNGTTIKIETFSPEKSQICKCTVESVESISKHAHLLFKEFQITFAWANNAFYWLWRTWVGDFRFNSYRSADLRVSLSYGGIKVKKMQDLAKIIFIGIFFSICFMEQWTAQILIITTCSALHARVCVKTSISRWPLNFPLCREAVLCNFFSTSHV